MYRLKLFSFIFLTQLYSCVPNNDDKTFVATSEVLEKSNRNILTQNESIYQELEDKSTDARYQEKTSFWEPKAKRVKYLSKDISDLISSLKNGSNLSQTSSYALLYQLLTEYKSYLLNLGEDLDKEFNMYDPYLSSAFDLDSISRKQFVSALENMKSIEKKRCILNSINNSSILAENTALRYCNNKCDFIRDYYSQFGVLVSQNSKHFKPNDELIIKAGIGDISRAAMPKIIIAGNIVPLEDNGLAEYRIKIASDTGKHIIPLVVSYIKPDGTTDAQSLNVEYYVH